MGSGRLVSARGRRSKYCMLPLYQAMPRRCAAVWARSPAGGYSPFAHFASAKGPVGAREPLRWPLYLTCCIGCLFGLRSICKSKSRCTTGFVFFCVCAKVATVCVVWVLHCVARVRRTLRVLFLLSERAALAGHWKPSAIHMLDNKTCHANYSLLTENKKSYTVHLPEARMSFIIDPAACSAGQLYFCVCSGSRPAGFPVMPHYKCRAACLGLPGIAKNTCQLLALRMR